MGATVQRKGSRHHQGLYFRRIPMPDCCKEDMRQRGVPEKEINIYAEFAWFECLSPAVGEHPHFYSNTAGYELIGDGYGTMGHLP